MTRAALILLFACPLLKGGDAVMPKTEIGYMQCADSVRSGFRATPFEARLLHALALVETGNNPSAVGRAGERTEFQMTPAMLRHYGTPLAMLRDLESQLPLAGMPVSEYTLAMAWHLGITKIRSRAITEADAYYARRVSATYQSNERTR